MVNQGFEVTQHYLLPTAWVARYSHGNGGRTIGVNSEMDALPGIGHACGHNLIAIAGVAVACAIKAAFEKHDINESVVLSWDTRSYAITLIIRRTADFRICMLYRRRRRWW